MGLPHITQTITYTTNGTTLKNKRKSNDAIHMVTGVQCHVSIMHLNAIKEMTWNN